MGTRYVLPEGFELAEYRISRVLGIGGFGITYLAVDQNLRTEVAIKEYYPINISVRNDDLVVGAAEEKVKPGFEKGLQDFLREARILANFRHPNIVAVLRFLEALGTAYLVMEYAQGESLRNKLVATSGRGLPEQQIRDILDPIIEGLSDLHEQGIIHRDIKPDNIFIREDGTPLLIDFGGAREFWSTDGTDLSTIISPNYTPIEQHGDQIAQGPWSDIYGLGGVAYAMVTWKDPISSNERASEDRMLSAQMAARGHYSEELLSAIDAALELDPRKRPQSLREWKAMLDARPHLPEDMGSLIETGYRKALEQIKEMSREVGIVASFEEAFVFAMAFCVIVLHHRAEREIVSEEAWAVCEPLTFSNTPALILAEALQNGRAKIEDKEIRSTFLERFEQYAAAHTLDRERPDGTYPLTAERLIRNVFPDDINGETGESDKALAAGADLLRKLATSLREL